MTNKKLLKMAMEIVDFPVKHGDFSIAMLNYQRVSCVFCFLGDVLKLGIKVF